MSTIKGKHTILEAIVANQTIQRITVSSQTKDHPKVKKIIQLAKNKGISIKVLPKDIFKKQNPEENNQGITAQLTNKEIKSLDTITKKKIKPSAIVALDHLEDPFNFGSIIRTCETLGVTCILYPKDRNVQLTAGVIKASSGALHHIDLIKVTNLAQSIIKLKKIGYWVYGTGEQKSIELSKCQPAMPFILIVGNENKGQSPRFNKVVDMNIRVPVKGQIGSLNVSVATGICLYQLLEKCKEEYNG